MQLIYNIVLIFGVQQWFIYIFFFKLFTILVITRYGIQLPVLYSKFLLSIYWMFSSLLIPHSNFMPPPLPPLVTNFLYVWESVSVLYIDLFVLKWHT